MFFQRYKFTSYTERRAKRFKILRIAFIIFLVFIVYQLISLYIIATYRIQADTMQPTFSVGDMIITAPFYSAQKDIERGTLVMVEPIEKPHQNFLRKTAQNVTIENLPENWDTALPFSGAYPEITLKEGEYFVLCDNRIASSDSRLWGPLQADTQIKGRILMRYWPFSRIALF